MFDFKFKKTKPEICSAYACGQETHSALIFNELEGTPIVCTRCVYMRLARPEKVPPYKKEWMP